MWYRRVDRPVSELAAQRRCLPPPVHGELMTSDELDGLLGRARSPVAAVAHSPGVGYALDLVADVLTMAEGVVPDGGAVPTLMFPRPAFAPEALPDRVTIRGELGLPVDQPIVATSGFLRFDRRFPDILTNL